MRANKRSFLLFTIFSLFGFLSYFFYLLSNNNLSKEFKTNLLRTKVNFSKIFIKSCDVEQINHIPNKSIAVIGHAYGNPGTENEFISPKVKSFLDQNITKFNLIIFSGDVFKTPSKEKWNKLFKMFGKKVEIIIAPGNHDVGFEDILLREEFNDSDFSRTIFPFPIIRKNHKIIIDDSTFNNWAIGEKTYKLIDYNDEFQKNIIIRHHIPVKDLLFLANSKDGFRKNLPSLNNLEKMIKENTLIIAGDSGAFKHLPRIFCTEKNNLKIIFNGIGDIEGDKIIIINEDDIYSYQI